MFHVNKGMPPEWLHDCRIELCCSDGTKKIGVYWLDIDGKGHFSDLQYNGLLNVEYWFPIFYGDDE